MRGLLTPAQLVGYMKYVHETCKITNGRRLAPSALRFSRLLPLTGIAPHPTPLAGTQGRTRRSWSWAESHSGHQRRRHVPQLFPASRAALGVGGTSPHPISLHFTLWIDTSNRGARHHGHSALPQWPPTHPAEVSYPWRPEIRGTDPSDTQILPPFTWGVNGKPPPLLVALIQICGNFINLRTIRCLPARP